jgi:regulatory protein
MFKKARPIKDPSNYDHGYKYALFLLNLSMRTEGELREKMRQRGYTSFVINEVINNLLQENYLNDANYAEVFINSMKNYKTWGRFMIQKKMYEKKLPQELINKSLNIFLTNQEEEEIAIRFLTKLYSDLSEIRSLAYDEKQALKRKLLSRGFGMDIVTKLIN